MSCLASAACNAATVQINLGDNVEAVANASEPGDTINFAPGTYTLATNSNGAAANWPGNRHYVGNGATIALSEGVAPNGNSQLITFGDGSEVSGFVFTDAQIQCMNGAFNVHDNTFTNNHNMAVFVAGDHDSHFDHNTFTNLAAEGISGYPGNNNTYDNNAFDHVFEPIHLVAQCDQTDVSGNVITHATRFGIELQNGMTHLTVSNNWMSDWLKNGNPSGHCLISCATGGDPNPPYAHQGEHITVSGNTLIMNGDLNPLNAAGVEIAGDADISVTDNYAWGCTGFLLNGATGQGVNSSNNVAVGGTLYAQDGAPWPEPQPHGTGDKLSAANDASAPRPQPYPGNATNAPLIVGVTATLTAPVVITGSGAGNVTPGNVTPAPRVAAPALPPGLEATAGADGSLSIACPAGSVPASLMIYPSTLAPTAAINLGPIAGNVIVEGIPDSWRVTCVVGDYTLPSIQITGGAATSFAPAIVSAPSHAATANGQPVSPATTPSEVNPPVSAQTLIQYQSLDGGKTIVRTN